MMATKIKTQTVCRVLSILGEGVQTHYVSKTDLECFNKNYAEMEDGRVAYFSPVRDKRFTNVRGSEMVGHGITGPLNIVEQEMEWLVLECSKGIDPEALDRRAHGVVTRTQLRGEAIVASRRVLFIDREDYDKAKEYLASVQAREIA
ncbi:MAG: hypothetical protein DI537_39470 [Stutzerimonas stutzeri]|nr:MAG: hypothetical protein DI537_39470 [Stutzerimonas stutzeri]